MLTFDAIRTRNAVNPCPANKILTTYGPQRMVKDVARHFVYRTKARDCRGCLLKNTNAVQRLVGRRKIPRSIYEVSSRR